MRFQIINRTAYPTRHLRAFVVRAYRVAATCAGPQRTTNHASAVPRIRVTFARANHRGEAGVTGHAYYDSGRAHVGLGDAANKLETARVIAHELGHCLGLHHSEMSGGPLMYTSDPSQRERVYGWAKALPLERTKPTGKPSADVRRRAAALSIEQRLKAWRTKQKRAATAIRKLTAQQRRIQRQLAAADQSPPATRLPSTATP